MNREKKKIGSLPYMKQSSETVVAADKTGEPQADLASAASVENTVAAEFDPLDDIADYLKLSA